MSYEEEFDKIVRLKAGQSEVPFNEGDWDKASAMLDARNAMQKTSMVKWLVPALFTVLAGFTVWYIVETKGAVVSSKNITVAQLENNNSVQAPSSAIVENVQVLQLPEAIQESEDIKQELHIDANVPQEANATPIAKPNSINKIDSKKEVPVLQEAKNEVLPNNSIVTEDGGKTLVSSNSAAPLNPIGKIAAPTLAANNLSDNEGIPEANQMNSKVEEPTIAADESMVNENKTEAVEKLSSEFMLSHSGFLLSNLGNTDVQQLPFTLLKRYDDDYYHTTRHRQYLMLEGGGMYSFGWNTPEGKDGVGADYYAGLKYGYYVARKMSVSLGAQMYSISNIAQPFYYAQHKSYSFGYSSAYTSVTTDHLVFGAVPLHLNYHFTKFSVIGAGVNVGYLLQNHSRIDTYGISDGVKGPTTSNGSYKVYETTSNVNMMGSVLLSTRVHPRLGLSAEFVYGFTDLFENTKNVSNIERTIGIRVGINYYIFEK